MKLRKLTASMVKNKRVIFRVGYDVPLIKQGKGFAVADDSRIVASLETLRFLQKHGAKIIILTWLKRPGGIVVEHLRLNPVARHLSKLIGAPVQKLDDCIGPEVQQVIHDMKTGDIVMLENVRFHRGEDRNDTGFAKQLASFGDVIVFDAFAHAHRDVASTTGILRRLPSVAGFSMNTEVSTLSKLLQKTKSPFVVVLGGAKVGDKIGVIKQFLKRADHILIGGAMVHAFLDSQHIPLGLSLREKYVDAKHHLAKKVAQSLLRSSRPDQLLLPSDLVATEQDKKTRRVVDLTSDSIQSNELFVDIGPNTIAAYKQILASAKTIFWNGPVGLFETKQFEDGTKAIAKAIAANKHFTVIGGGDTERAISQFKLTKRYSYVSTGGGASLEFLAHGTLPVIKYLI